MLITESSFTPRQHVETEIHEIVGGTVKNILAVKGDRKDTLLLVYISIRGAWLRMFLDAGLVFISVCNAPDEEDDLEDDKSYLDIAASYELQGQEVRKASFKDNVFRLGFASGVELLLEPDGEKETAFRVTRP